VSDAGNWQDCAAAEKVFPQNRPQEGYIQLKTELNIAYGLVDAINAGCQDASTKWARPRGTFVRLIRGNVAPREFGCKLRRFRRGLLFLVMAGAVWAQTESQIESDQVKRVGTHLNCQCGCNDDLNCMMSGGQCPFCRPERTKIFRMQQAGMSDAAIITSFLKDFGDRMFRPDPNSSFWLVPYFSFGAGGLLLVFILMRMRGRARKHPLITVPAGAPSAAPYGGSDASFARYRQQIEKDTATLD
jgi:cytochrome c-type biogenesis protein CcmH/NrfF